MATCYTSLYDVAVIGGGAAGLSAALLLGRACCRTVLFDHGQQRNRSAAAIHGFPSRDGMKPSEFIAECHRQLQKYEGITRVHSNVERCVRTDGEFEVFSHPAGSFRAVFLLVASGVEDVLPNLPGLEKYYGSSAHHCPYCDAWEHRGQPLGVYGSDKAAVSLALELVRWSEDVSIYSETPDCCLKDFDRLRMAGVKARFGKVVGLDGTGGSLSKIHLDGDRTFACLGLFFPPKASPRLSFLTALGCRTDETGHLVATYDGVCSVAGVFAAGNTCDGLQMVVEAAAKGTRAAHSIIQALIARDELGRSARLNPRPDHPLGEGNGVDNLHRATQNGWTRHQAISASQPPPT
jgi:thioredoxin reductase